MARTIEEIYNQLIYEKENFDTLKQLQPNYSKFQTFLQDLTSSTKVARWRLILFVVAVAIHLHEVVCDLWWEDVENKRLSFPAGTREWYADKILNFQFGYDIEWNGNQFYYKAEDENAKIVKYVSLVEKPNLIIAKVAKDNNGQPEPLTESERNALQSYLDTIGFLGIKVNVLSPEPDTIDLGITVIVDGFILDTNGQDKDGNYPVVNAINKYLAELDFGGVFRIIDLVDAIQQVNGVKNVVVYQAVLNTVIGSIDVKSKINEQVESYAGYIKTNVLNIQYLV